VVVMVSTTGVLFGLRVVAKEFLVLGPVLERCPRERRRARGGDARGGGGRGGGGGGSGGGVCCCIVINFNRITKVTSESLYPKETELGKLQKKYTAEMTLKCVGKVLGGDCS